MSKLHYLPLALLMLGCEQKSVTDVVPQVEQSSRLTVETYSHAWSKDRRCLRGEGDCAIGEEPTISKGVLSNRTPRVSVSVVNGQLEMRYLTALDPVMKTVTINPTEEFYVMSHVAKGLGYHSIKIKQGVYPVDRSQGEHGLVRFAIETE